VSFRTERNKALLSGDETTIRIFAWKYNLNVPTNREAFWRGIHKAITGCLDLPEDYRLKSKQWLDERGSKAWDDGDLILRPDK
jgi:hypothetical protein